MHSEFNVKITLKWRTIDDVIQVPSNNMAPPAQPPPPHVALPTDGDQHIASQLQHLSPKLGEYVQAYAE